MMMSWIPCLSAVETPGVRVAASGSWCRGRCDVGRSRREAISNFGLKGAPPEGRRTPPFGGKRTRLSFFSPLVQ